MLRDGRRPLPAALLLACAAWSGLAASEPPSARVTLATVETYVGDAVPMTLAIEVPDGTRVDRPEIGTQVGPMTFTFESWEGPGDVPAIDRWTWTGTVAAFETGDLEVPALEVRVTGAEGEAILRTEPVALRVRTVLASDEAEPDLADLKDPVSVRPDYDALLTAVGVFLVLLAVALLAWWLQRRYGRRLAAVSAPDDPFHRVPPHEWIYRELQSLLERRLAEQGEVERFFAELAWILKRYLGGRYRVELMERTTAEVVPVLRQAGAPREAISSTREILERADRVKFAGERPAPGECKAAVESVYRIVDATRPVESDTAERGAA